MMEFAAKPETLRQGILQNVGELHRDIAGGAARQVDHDVTDFGGFDPQIDPADDVRLVFARRQPRCHSVGRNR